MRMRIEELEEENLSLHQKQKYQKNEEFSSELSIKIEAQSTKIQTLL